MNKAREFIAAHWHRRAGRRADDQLPEVLLSLCSGLRAGLSLPQAMAAASGEAGPPLGPELLRCTREIALGRSWSESLRALTQRLPGDDLTFLAWALTIHQRTGGDLPALCDRLYDLLVERRRVRAKLAATTAQSRLSAAVVALVPLFLIIVLHDLAPGYLDPLIRTPAGWLLLGWAGVMNLTGGALIMRISAPKW
ncbi:MAG: type II secretion system F family protein [Chitinophagales bacterium]